MSIEVLKPGALTTVQDAGRYGQRHLGVGTAGALDAFSSRVANLLVGNDADAALLEITLTGPTLRFAQGARIALAGATGDARIGNVALPSWRRIDVPAGSELRLGACRDGARTYLAIAGGIGVDVVMQSHATDVRGGFGGLAGRALRAGDRLPLRAPREVETLRIAAWWLDARPDLALGEDAIVHAVPGADRHDALFEYAWRVTPASDRQGVRLEPAPQARRSREAADAAGVPALSGEGGAPSASHASGERVSSPVAPGTIQLPPDGHPIVLLADAQTVGGYPIAGFVATADLPRLAQCRPGDSVRFVRIDRDGALARWRAQAARLARMALAIAARG